MDSDFIRWCKVVEAYEESSWLEIVKPCNVKTCLSEILSITLWLTFAFLVSGLAGERCWIASMIVFGLAIFLFWVSFKNIQDCHNKKLREKKWKDCVIFQKFYGLNWKFHRYQNFAKRIQNIGIKPSDDFGEFFQMIELEKKNEKKFWENGLTSALVVSLAAILGGAASISQMWSSGIMPFVFIVLVTLFIVHTQRQEMLTTPVDKMKEIEQFLRWYQLDHYEDEDYLEENKAALSKSFDESEEVIGELA